jgi:hypothetical protein
MELNPDGLVPFCGKFLEVVIRDFLKNSSAAPVLWEIFKGRYTTFLIIFGILLASRGL